MEARVFDKRKLPSRHVTEGPEHAPHRSYYYAMGLSSQGPKGGPGMREMLSTTAALYGQGSGEKVALITDGRFSAGTLSVRLDEATLAARKKNWKARPSTVKSGARWKYAQGVGPAVKGAVTHPGGSVDAVTYADI